MLVFAIPKTIPIYLDSAMLRAHDRRKLSLKGSEARSRPHGQCIPVSSTDNFVRRTPDENLALTSCAALCSALLFLAAVAPPPPTHKAACPRSITS